VLAVGPAGRRSGYARVLRGILTPIAERLELEQFAVDDAPAPCSCGWPIHRRTAPGDAYGRRRLGELIEGWRPDLLFVVFDIWLYYAYLPLLERRFPELPVVLYCPIDGEAAEPRYLRRLGSLGRLVLFTRFAREVVEEAWAADPEAVRRPPISILPHGVDTALFRPLVREECGEPHLRASRRLARRRLFPDRPELEDAFLVLNANQNNLRKRVDLTLESFARFARGKPPGVYLYLHMDVGATGCELLPIARRLGIEDRLLLGSPGGASTDDEAMNLVYNACDVGLNTSTGEGWGLVAFEHAATGGAQVLPAHSVHPELWGGVAELVAVGARVRTRHDFLTRHRVDPVDVAAALDRLYGDPALLRERSLAAYQHAMQPALDWERIAAQWESLFRRAPVEARRDAVHERPAEYARYGGCRGR
jgi:glycosyltransferase involved in cell wall biosynthesis